MRNSTLRVAGLAMAMALAVPACGHAPPPEPQVLPDAESVTVRVENNSGDDMTVYYWRSAQRVRLGTVSVASTQTFRIPKVQIMGATTLRFEADPLGRRRSSISQEIPIREGDELVLRLGPN